VLERNGDVLNWFHLAGPANERMGPFRLSGAEISKGVKKGRSSGTRFEILFKWFI
jgi:hypothetical protein